MEERGGTQTLLDAVVRASPAAIVAVDMDRTVRLWNPAATELFGYDAADVVGGELPVVPVDAKGTLDRVLSGELVSGLECERLASDGEAIPCELWAAPIHDGADIVGGVGVYVDLRDRAARDRELVRKGSLLDTVFETLPVHMYAKDREGRHVRLSSQFVENPDEHVGETDLETGLTDPEYARESHADDMHVVETGEPILDKEEYYPDLDRWFLTSKVPWRTPDGEIVGLLGVSRDITERKEREQLITRQKDQLAVLNRIVRHDIRNDMSIAAGWLEHLADDLPEESREDATRVLDSIRQTLELTDMVGDVLAVVEREETFDLVPVDLTATVETEVAQARRGYPEATFDVDGTAPCVRANAMLASVVKNLLANAVEHNDREAPHVEVTLTTCGDTVELTVADDGPGVPVGQREEVFGRGEKGLESGGSGLGLFLVDRLADAYGGSVAVTDNDPRGAVFTVRLPRARA